jgi:outer membrane protein OmpA-like peptidoglycan-associated protein
MQKTFALALLTAALISGCSKSKEKIKKDDHKTAHIPLHKKKDKNSFFDDEVEAFVLEDDFAKQDAQVAMNSTNQISWVAEQEGATKGLKPIYFDFDQASIEKGQEVILQRDVEEAKKLVAQGKKVIVEGHACHSAGSRAYNLLISEHRAHEVAKRLEEEGIASEALKTVGRGTEMPVVLGGDRHEQAPNRRVEMFPLTV